MTMSSIGAHAMCWILRQASSGLGNEVPHTRRSVLDRTIKEGELPVSLKDPQGIPA